ncbi:DMT family transporter [Candidatus Nitrospira nitrificans]|uniref:Putative Transporter, eamA family n=1 Tax=Candidatus Nitrospira nitrificans TaxID=1742973 RepID=A0A0S4L743_9BACT|nr:DMT family transporter [Candidatus Nitrospira nitrificans]CUS33553.1 putative Transporter, eamA family [Candidatus Nitrospira nitrificans]
MPRLALLLTTVIWGATFPATKAALEQISPLSFLLLRFLLGTLLVVLWFVICRRRLHHDRAVLRASALTTVFLFFGYLLQTVGLGHTSASNSAFLTALYVIFVPLMLMRIDGRVVSATAIAVVGLWLLVKPDTSMNLGNLMTLGCAVAFAGHIICLERFTRQVDAPSLLVWQMVAMTVLFLPAPWWEGTTQNDFLPTTVLLIGLGVTGVLATLAFAVQIWAQQQVPAQQVALLFASEPAYAAWLSWYFLGETLDVHGWIGSALILLAVLIGAWGG